MSYYAPSYATVPDMVQAGSESAAVVRIDGIEDLRQSELDNAIARRDARGGTLIRIAIGIEVGTGVVAALCNYVLASTIRHAFPSMVNACGEWSVAVIIVPFLFSAIALAVAMVAPAEYPRSERNRTAARLATSIATLGWLLLLVAKDYPHCIS